MLWTYLRRIKTDMTYIGEGSVYIYLDMYSTSAIPLLRVPGELLSPIGCIAHTLHDHSRMALELYQNGKWCRTKNNDKNNCCRRSVASACREDVRYGRFSGTVLNSRRIWS